LMDLASSYRKTGQRDKSADSLRSIVDKYPNSPFASKARKELSSLQAEGLK
jgi:outer membrane protein assembly factor BamD (BamD/ComL family)